MLTSKPDPFDPFLWTHEITTHVYDISSGLQPISTRDQIVRGALLVRRAWHAGIINSQPGHGVLVVGAGVGGAAVALQAAYMGIPVTLIEKRRYPFVRQRFCASRIIDTTLYDWPAAHWKQVQHPWHPNDEFPLVVAMDLAHKNAREWQTALEHAAALFPHFQIRYRTRLVNFPIEPTNGLFEAHLDDNTAGQFRMIVLAAGVGQERRARSSFRSYRFWDTDRLETVDRTDRVLISGGGDGALQDFLRVALKPRTQLRRLMHKLKISAEDLHRFQDWTAHGKSYFVWCGTVGHEHDCERFLHQENEEFIADLLSGTHSNVIIKALEESVREVNELPEIHLAFPCDHFTRCYTVNRFLALLVARFIDLRAKGGRRTLREFQGLADVKCVHKPSQTPSRRGCFRARHTVTWTAQNCSLQPVIRDVPPPETYTVIVLRHGTIPEPCAAMGVEKDALKRGPFKFTRHVLPAHLGHLP
jgi:hypothetical protein